MEEYREEKKGKLQRTLYSGSSAANSKVNKVSVSFSAIRIMSVFLDRQQETPRGPDCPGPTA